MVQPPVLSSPSAAEIAHDMAEFPPVTWQEKLGIEIKDAGFLRHLWRNFDAVAPGVYRSNHPGARRLRGYADFGIKAVLSLRGNLRKPMQRHEAAICAQVGIEFHSVSLNARRFPQREALLQLLHKFDTLPRPFLMHCKSGADRAGLASALYLIDKEGASVDAARKALSFKYLHIKRSETGVLDQFLDLYEAAGDVPLRSWIAETYTKQDADAAYGRTR